MSWLNSLRRSVGVQPESRAIRGLSNSVAWASDNSGLLTDQSYSLERVAGFPPVSQALQMIAGDCAKIPLHVFSRVGDDRVRADDHYASQLIDLWGQPNNIDTTFDLLFDWFFHALLFGGGYLWVERDGPYPIGLQMLPPDRTKPLRRNGKRYFVTEIRNDVDRSQIQALPDDDVLYLPGISLDGLQPSHPLRLYKSTFEQAIAEQDFTARFFENGTHQGGLIFAPPGASEIAINQVEGNVKARSDRQNWFKTLILKDGFRWQSTTSEPKNATLIELDENLARHVARIYNLPPSKLGLKDAVSYNSLEQDNQQYLDSTLSTWLIQSRSQCHKKLIIPSERRTYFVDYLIDALLWSNATTRASIATQGIQSGWLKKSEVRRWYNLPNDESLD